MTLFQQIQDYLTNSPVASFIFLITMITSIRAFSDPLLKEKFMLRPYSFVHDKKYFQVLTSGLIHSNWLHLGMNMVAFFFFAFALDDLFVLLEAWRHPDEISETQDMINKFVGHGKFLVLYIACMVVADFTTIIRFKNVPSYASLGASGAISGVVISTIMMYGAMGADAKIWGIPGWLFAIGYIAFSSFAARRRSSSQINHDAHLWGALAGIVFTSIMFPTESWRFAKFVVGTISGFFG